ncbi:MAG TPA: TetR/AcrR family transcriptional regulator [Rhodanobacteraceae bacterium]|nr:TetR/AcrR family transcriptional regulator [Rhodanobacteraceae bacterium]
MRRRTTAEKILRAAYDLFDREGADAVTMRRVAEAVGITPMAIYRHFASREALLKKISDENFQAVARKLDACRREPDITAQLNAMMMPYLDYALEHPHLFDHAFAVQRDDARRYPDDMRARKSPSFNISVDAIAEGMRQGVLKQDDPYAVCMTASAHQHGLIALYRAGRFNYDEAQFRAFYKESMGRLIDGLKK